MIHFVIALLPLVHLQASLHPDALEQAFPNMTVIAPDVAVRRVTQRVWVFTFLHKLDDGTVYPANGMYVVSHGKGMLVDPGWDTKQASTLFQWAQSKANVQCVVATHFHEDRIGGLPFFAGKDITSYATSETIQLARRHGRNTAGWTALKLVRGQIKRLAGLQLLFPGAGHAPDNIVVYDPVDRILYGGCFVKSITATNLGNRSDAEVKSWPASVALVKQVFISPHLVVPGHGTCKGDGLQWTSHLLRKEGAR